jgi:hypothetical protein
MAANRNYFNLRLVNFNSHFNSLAAALAVAVVVQQRQPQQRDLRPMALLVTTCHISPIEVTRLRQKWALLMRCAASACTRRCAPNGDESLDRVAPTIAERNAFIDALSRAERDGLPVAAVRAFCASREPPPAGAAQNAWDLWSGELAKWHEQGEMPLPSCPGKVEGGGCKIGETALRGITLRQLRRLYIEASERCKAEGWRTFDAASRSWTGPLIVPEELDLYALTQYWIKPQTAARQCSMVELVADGAQPPRFFVSHWWGEPVKDFIACLEVHVKDHKNRGVDLDTPYWVRAPRPRAAGLLTVSRSCSPSLLPLISNVLTRRRPQPLCPGPLPITSAPPLRPCCCAQVCAYANNQHSIGAELGDGVMASPFVRALYLADGMVTVTDEYTTVLTRAWCGFEAFVSTSLRGAKMKHDIYTAGHFRDKWDKAVGAVGLVDGFAAADCYDDGTGNSKMKAKREAGFSPQLAERAALFDLAMAEASEAADKVAIVKAVGKRTDALNATVRARYAVGLLPKLLEGGDPQRLATYCTVLAASELRSLSLYCGENVSAEAARFVVSALPASLVELLADSIGNGAVGAIAMRIERGQLLRLSLERCGLTAADTSALVAALGASGARLRELELGYTRVRLRVGFGRAGRWR